MSPAPRSRSTADSPPENSWQIIAELQRDGHARIDPAQAGSPLTAFFQLRCRLDSCLLKTTTADELPEVTEIHKLSGNWCTMLKVRVADIPHLEGLIERLGKHGEMNSHIVLSTQFDGRPVEPPSADTRTVTQPPGWHR